MARDYYVEAEQIAERLASEGMTGEADALRNVISAGSTATEILMGLRWHLQNIDRANRTTNITTKRSIRELIAELNKVLS